MLMRALPRGLIPFVVLICFAASPAALAGGLDAKLCGRADLISGECQTADALTAGEPGFALSIASRFAGNVLVTVTWERLSSSAQADEQSEQLAQDMVVLGPGQAKLVPFRARSGELEPGRFRLIVAVAGEKEQTISFAVVAAQVASATDAAPSRMSGQAATRETITGALGRVFAENEGPEAAKAGIEIIGEFFDRELGAPREPKMPSQRSSTSSSSDGASHPPTTTTAPAADALPEAIESPSQSSEPVSVQAPEPSGTVTQPNDFDGLQLVLARRLDDQMTPIDTPEVFDAADPAIYLAIRATMPGLPDLVRVEWITLQVEGMPAGERLTDSDTVLRQGAWRRAVFLPPEGGFWPGRYEARVSTRDGASLGRVELELRSGHETALLSDDARPTSGINLAHATLGGTVVRATSEANGSSWAKERLIDGFGYGGEDCMPACGWASAGRKFPQELVFAFHRQEKARLQGMILDGESCAGDLKCLRSLPRLVEIWTSSDSSDAEFELAATRRLRPVTARHYIPLPGVEARYVKLVIRSSYGGTRRTQLAEVEILEAPGPRSIVSALPVDLALPAFGGTLLRHSSERYGAEAVRLLHHDNDDKGWRSSDGALPQELTFCLRDDREALIERLQLGLDSGFEPTSRPREIAVALSSSSPTGGFVEAARVQVPADADTLSIPLDRKARFINLRILENRGGDYTSLGRVSIIEGRAPGYESLLARAPRQLSEPSAATALTAPDLVASSVQPGATPEQALLLELGARVGATFADDLQRHYYALTLPGDQPGMLNLELSGRPFLRTRLLLRDGDGNQVATFSPRRDADPTTLISWRLEPGRYLLEAEIVPANIVLAWDVSRSMSAHTVLLRQAVIGFLEQVDTDEKIALIAFNDNLHVLTKDFTDDKAVLLDAVSGRFKAEMATRLYDAIEKGTQLLSEADGAGVMVVMTDGVDMGSSLSAPQFWDLMDRNPVRMLTLGLGGELKVTDPKAGISGGHLLRHIAEVGGGRFIYIPSADGLVEIYGQIADELMSGTNYSLKPTWTFSPGTLLVETVGDRIGELVAPPRIELVLDASGSMKKRLDGKARMDIAKEVLSELIQTLPEDVDVALRVYGHRIREGRKGDCRDTELVYPFGRLDKARLTQGIMAIKPLGTTPIAYALAQTGGDFGESQGEKTVILVTDGKEECGGDLVATVAELRAQGLDVRLHVVGFALDEPEVVGQMRQAAEAGRGRYLSAADQPGLKRAIAKTMAVPYTVRDSADILVGKGVAGRPLSLLAGYYRIALDTPAGKLLQQRVEVAQGKTTIVRVTKDGPEIGVQVLPPEAPAGGAD